MELIWASFCQSLQIFCGIHCIEPHYSFVSSRYFEGALSFLLMLYIHDEIEIECDEKMRLNNEM